MRIRVPAGMVLVMAVPILTECEQLTGIHAAAYAGEVAQVRALLDQDPELVNAVESAGWTPLHFAAQRGHTELVELLLARGADINTRLRQGGGTPLHVAATTGQKSIVALLLARGAGANARDANELTPLHRAAISGNREVAELLLANGANAHAWSNTGFTPIDQALEAGYPGFANRLRERGRAQLPLADDFSGSCRWSSGENDRLSFGCEQDAYRLTLKRPGPVHIPRNFGWGAPAVSVDIDVGVASGRGLEAGNALLGIGCLSDRWHGYVTILNTNGSWAIMRITKEFTQLSGTNEAGAITGLAQTNRLRAVCASEAEATVVSFFVNDLEVGSVRDEPGFALFNGVVLYTDTFPGVVAFDRFGAREPPEEVLLNEEGGTGVAKWNQLKKVASEEMVAPKTPYLDSSR